MRVVVCVAALAAVASTAAFGAATPTPCPHDAALGSFTYVRSGTVFEVGLASCASRTVGKAPAARRTVTTPDGRFVATTRATGHGKTAKQTIWVTDRHTGRTRRVFTEPLFQEAVTGLGSRGPIEILRLSHDGRYVFFAIDPDSSASIAADGLIVRVVSTTGGKPHALGIALTYQDYLTWCGGRLVFVGGGDRIAVHAKRLLEAAPPGWRPRPLWNDRRLSFASPACAPDGRSIAVLVQPSSVEAGFFATRWHLWRIGLAGGRTELDTPPPGWADESPAWSPDGRSVLFARERNGYGRVMLLHDGRLFGPLANLGYSLGFYGHHDWGVAWRR